MARMMMGANSHRNLRSGQSETDLIGMVTLNRSCHDKLFNAVPYAFRAQLKSGGNPAHDRMSVKLRLEEKVNWLSSDRSDAEQRLTVKFLVNWCNALLTDLGTYGSGDNVTKEQILAMRAQYPNILVNEQQWDTQVEAQRVADKGLRAYCVHPTVHAETQRGSVRAIAKHKLECWTEGNN